MNRKKQSKLKSKERPFVSVCTPTFNRRPFIPIVFEIFKNQDYPKNRLEWIIVDDGTDSIADLIETSGIPEIKYHRINEKLTLGKKRNYMHSLINPKSDYIIYFDDDDWYPHDRISHSIEMLEKHPSFLIAGSSELYCYFKMSNTSAPSELIQFGPYGPNHSTAGTFCFHRKLLSITKYDDTKELAEEKSFLKDYSIPLYQLNPLKTILIFSHEHNTFDKRNLLKQKHPNNPYIKTSEKTVDAFFRTGHSTDERIKRFFMEEIDDLLAKYEPGEPKNKPNTIKQIEEIRKERESMQSFTPPNGSSEMPKLMIQPEGQPPREISFEEIPYLLQSQQDHINHLTNHIKDLENQCDILQKKLTEVISKVRS